MSSKALAASDEIFNSTLQILNAYSIEAIDVPFVMAHVENRINAFAIGKLAHDIEEKQMRIAELEKEDEPEPTEGTE